MGYEIDFLAVGEESKGGDAISFRLGELNTNRQFIVVIDGGYDKNGEKFVDSIKARYGNPDTIDLVVSTHPDADHINGLSHVLDEFEVKELWLHQPWKHNNNIASKLQDGSIDEPLKEAWGLYKKARKKGIVVEEPFSCNESMIISLDRGQLKILGPSKEYYEELLPEFDAAIKPTDSSPMSTQEVWGKDSIKDDGETSAKNNSSVILELSYDSKRFIFTADAGIPALKRAASKAGQHDPLELIQIPHHGSRRNVGPMVLDLLVGGIVSENKNKSISAIVSCPKENPKNNHPNKRVLNAFTRRGCNCYKTEGSSFCCCDSSYRGPTNAKPCGFYKKVEKDS